MSSSSLQLPSLTQNPCVWVSNGRGRFNLEEQSLIRACAHFVSGGFHGFGEVTRSTLLQKSDDMNLW